MLLRVSGQKSGLDVDLAVAMDAKAEGDAGVPSGEALLAFASAANNRAEDLAEARDHARSAGGGGGLAEGAATVAVFNGLVRVADGTGIQLDPSMMTGTVEDRERLGIDAFAGAASSVGAPTDPRHQAPGLGALFS